MSGEEPPSNLRTYLKAPRARRAHRGRQVAVRRDLLDDFLDHEAVVVARIGRITLDVVVGSQCTDLYGLPCESITIQSTIMHDV